MFLNLDLSDSENLAIEMAASMVQFDAAWEIMRSRNSGWNVAGPPPLRAQLSAPDELIALHDAIDERRVISFVYGGQVREVEPVLVFWRGKWYVHAYEGGFQNFKVERLQSSVSFGEEKILLKHLCPL